MKALPLPSCLPPRRRCFAADASAQQRKPPAGAEAKSSECSASLGELPKAWDGQAFAIDGHTLGGVGLKRICASGASRRPSCATHRVESVPGMRARAFLADLLAKADHKVKCRPARFDRECRIVAQCSVADPAGARPRRLDDRRRHGLWLRSRRGAALGIRAGQRYADAEFEARKARKGLWPVWLGDQ